MATSNVLSVSIALVVGIALGFLHFGGLWLTLQYLPTARQPHRLVWTSAMGRLGISAVGLYGVVRGADWVHLLVCLGGFLSMRYVLVRRWRSAAAPLPSHREVRHGYHPD